MLKQALMTEHTDAPELSKYVRLVDLAKKLNKGQDWLYGYIYRYNNRHQAGQIDTFTIPGKGRSLHMKREDAEMLYAVFTNPEDYAEKVTRKPK